MTRRVCTGFGFPAIPSDALHESLLSFPLQSRRSVRHNSHFLRHTRPYNEEHEY